MVDFAHTHARRSDPDTSFLAADAAGGLATRHKATIATVLASGRLTSAEISDRCDLNYWQVARRIADLKHDQLVCDSGLRRLSPNGRKACVWRLVKRQIEMFA